MAQRPGSVRIDDLAAPVLPDEVVQMRELLRGTAESLPFALDALEGAAAGDAGLDDFGDDLYREPYAVLLRALDTEAGLGPLGRFSNWNAIKQFLVNRLLIVDYIKRHPEVSEIEIAAPIVICGLPRTGTTHLHNLMSADPHLRSLPWWEALEPVPPLAEQSLRPADAPVHTDPRWQRADAGLANLARVLPYQRRMHDMYTDHVHEEIHLLAIAGSTMLFDCMAPMPTWREWYKGTDQTPYYLWTKKILQVLQHQRGPNRWVLKSPQHLEQFRPLITAYPDGWFVLTHRDPVSITASFCTMIAYSARMSQENLDARQLGHHWAQIIEDFLRAAVEDRDVLPAERSVDVRFDDFMADDVATVERLYEWCGQPFTAEVRRHMDRFMADHPRGKWGSVEYHLDDFDIDAAERRRALAFYSERFGLRDES